MGCNDSREVDLEQADSIKSKDDYFQFLVEQIKRVRGVLEKYSGFLNSKAKKKTNEVSENNYSNLSETTARDKKIISFGHEKFYIFYCNTLTKLKSNIEDIFFFENYSADYKAYDKARASNKDKNYPKNFKKNKNDYLHFYRFELDKAKKYLRELLECEEKYDLKKLKELDNDMENRVFVPREGFIADMTPTPTPSGNTPTPNENTPSGEIKNNEEEEGNRKTPGKKVSIKEGVNVQEQ